MQRSNSFKALPIIITIIVIALAIAAIVSIGKVVFSGNSSSEEAVLVDEGREALLNTTGGRSVQLTVRGPIVADEAFKSYQVEISNSERSITAYEGYLESRTDGTTLSNNIRAYEQFVYALDKANFMKGQETEDDLRGICATGYVYEYAVLSGGSPVKMLWTSTCSGSKGSLDASREQLTNLFLEQIPDSADYIPFERSFRLSL